MSMKQNAAEVPTALHGYLTEISRKGEYLAQLCGRHFSVLQPQSVGDLSSLSLPGSDSRVNT
jgi:hypothetical protein